MKDGNKVLNIIKILYIVDLIILVLGNFFPLGIKFSQTIYPSSSYSVLLLIILLTIEAICFMAAVVLLHLKMVIYALIVGIINIGLVGTMQIILVLSMSFTSLDLGSYLYFVVFALLIAINLWLIKFFQNQEPSLIL